MRRDLIIGTAGHIDHGKSALVKALTGIDPDRLKEEKERGITIDLGFASLDLSPDLHVGFVDVPGHERFIKNMLAGVGGIDAVLLVIAADEGIMPQTREHFDICRLLNIPAGVVALSKADLVEKDLLDLVRLEIDEFLQQSFLRDALVIPVSSETREGLEELKQALLQLGKQIEVKSSSGTFRLPIDRCFSLHGYGTIVTGTLISGTLSREMEVEIYPSGKRSRIRNIQVHSETVEVAKAGQRTAVNLQGIEVAEIKRGMVLALPRRFRPASLLEVSVRVLADSPMALKPRSRVRFHQGTAELMATISPIEKGEMQPGDCGYARIHLESSLLTLPGDHFIIRRFSPMVTIGGGEILDIRPARRRFTPDPRIGFLRVMESKNWSEIICEISRRNGTKGIAEEELSAITNWDREKIQSLTDRLAEAGRLKILTRSPLLAIGQQEYQSLKNAVLKELNSFHLSNPLLPGMPKEQLASVLFAGSPLMFKGVMEDLTTAGEIVLDQERVLLKGRGVALNDRETAAKERIEKAFWQAGWRVPGIDEVLREVDLPREQTRRLVALLIKEKRLIKIAEDLLFHTEAIEQLKGVLAGQKKLAEKIDVPQFKTLTNISRKYAIPLLEYLDREKVTRRVGDYRIIL
jgi:selenocysteine-specific elongation factor